MGLKGADFMSWLPTSQGKLQAQKSPQSLRRASFQDFVSGSGDHQPRILGWRELNPRPKFLHSYMGH